MIRIIDSLMFRNKEIVISADIISISHDFITFKTVEPLYNLKDYICRWSEQYKPETWKAAAKELEAKRAGLNFTFNESESIVSLSLNRSSGLINNEIFHYGIESVVITDELLKELLTYLKVLFTKVFAYTENREQILKIFERIEYNQLQEVVIDALNHRTEFLSDEYWIISELVSNKTINEAVLEEMLQKVENICKYRINQDLLFTLINDDEKIIKMLMEVS